jgi:hypothetical protein
MRSHIRRHADERSLQNASVQPQNRHISHNPHAILLPVYAVMFQLSIWENHVATNFYYCSFEWHTLKDNTAILYRLFLPSVYFFVHSGQPIWQLSCFCHKWTSYDIANDISTPSRMVMQWNGSKCRYSRPNTSADSPHTTQLWQTGMAAGIRLTRTRGSVAISCHVIITLIIIKHDGSQANSPSKQWCVPFSCQCPP